MEKRIGSIFIMALLALATLGAITYTSCTKSSSSDPCSGITCLNGGACSAGTCSCPSGYTGTYCGLLATTSIQYNNTTYTPIVITVNGANSTIPVGGSVTYTGSYGSTLDYTAYTYGTNSSGDQIGEEVTWNSSDIFPDAGTLSINLFVNSSVFFLKIQNENATYAAQGLYVNYGLTAQTYDNNFSVPNNGQVYNIGYYNAYTNTEFYMYSSPSGTYWNYYPIFSFVNNQYYEWTLF